MGERVVSGDVAGNGRRSPSAQWAGAVAQSRRDVSFSDSMFMLQIAGLVVFALMIGLITESVAEQVDDFKKGRSRVLERDHTLMIGWSSKSIPVLDQLALAAESEGGANIVVLTEHDKEDMEEDLKSACLAVESPLDLRGSQVGVKDNIHDP